jgi:hypothetical protein
MAALGHGPENCPKIASDGLPRLDATRNEPHHWMRPESRNGETAVPRRIADTQFPAKMVPFKFQLSRVTNSEIGLNPNAILEVSKAYPLASASPLTPHNRLNGRILFGFQ